MITEARIREELRGVEGLEWISSLRSPQIRKLVTDSMLQPSLFDEVDLAEIHHPSFPGERHLTDLASRGETRSFSSTLLRRWPGSGRVQNLHRGEHEFAGPQLPWLSARQYAIFFFADHTLA